MIKELAIDKGIEERGFKVRKPIEVRAGKVHEYKEARSMR